MKYFLAFLLCFSFLVSKAQEPVYTPMRQNYQFRGIRVDSLFLIPSFVDTTSANTRSIKRIAGAMIRTGNDFWMRNADTSAWLQNVNIGSGASPIVNFVNNVFKKVGTDSVFYVVAPADTFFSFRDIGDTLDLQQVTDNGDTTTNIIYFYDDGNLSGHTSTVKIGTGIIDGSNYGSIVGIYGDVIDANPHKIELFTTKGDGSNNIYMISGGEIFSIINAAGTTTISSSNELNISSEIMDLQGDSLIRIIADRIQQTISDSIFLVERKFDGNDLLKIDTLGNAELGDIAGGKYIKVDQAGDKITLNCGNPPEVYNGSIPATSLIQTMYSENAINISAADYTISTVGFYVVSNADNSGTYEMIFPAAAQFKGLSFSIVNTDAADDCYLSVGTGNIYDRGTGNALTIIPETQIGIFYSDGTNWYGYTQ